MSVSQLRSGGCACGAVRFLARGVPKRTGLCHCLTCRKAHAAAFNPFVVFDRWAVQVSGETRRWESSPGYSREFCPVCGSRVLGANGDEVEVSLGSFDRPGEVTPEYESWVVRREPWLAPLDVTQFPGDRT
jgi:hypothetical protein